ncbi:MULTISPECIES: hypothetical protein [Microvirgula]|uniref:hypothetical protein n=1 Tax=Microvirgula TaxID=57479 RepID=UPI0011BFDAD3|nr:MULTISPECIES: hypothetical protein [Microvirgula]
MDLFQSKFLKAADSIQPPCHCQTATREGNREIARKIAGLRAIARQRRPLGAFATQHRRYRSMTAPEWREKKAQPALPAAHKFHLNKEDGGDNTKTPYCMERLDALQIMVMPYALGKAFLCSAV